MVDADELDIELDVVIDSFLLAHDVIKPKAARTAMDVIRDCFIDWWLTSAQNVQPPKGVQALIQRSKRWFQLTYAFDVSTLLAVL